MTASHSRWLEAAQVARAEGGPEALAILKALSPGEQRDVVGYGERLAERSLAAAQAYALRAPAARRDLPAAAFAAWANLGLEIAGPLLDSREATVAFFRLDPAVIATLDPDDRRLWIDLCAEVQRVSRRLAATCLESSGRVLGRLGGSPAERLEAWARAGIALAEGHGWRGEFLAVAWLGAAEDLLPVLEPEEIRAFAALGAAVQSGRELDAAFLKRLPERFADLDAGTRGRVLAACRRAANVSPRAAADLFRHLPAVLAEFPATVRRALLAAVDATAAEPASFVALLPLLPAIVRSVTQAQRARLLERVARAGERFPTGLSALLRSLPRVVEEAGVDRVREWIAHGERIAADNPEAGRAYFALESRTAIERLRTASAAVRLDDVQGVLRSYTRMLSATPLEIRAGDAVSLRPFIDRESLDGSSIALPGRVDLFESWEDNFSLLKLMAANAVGRLFFGTWGLSVSGTADRLPQALGSWLRGAVAGDRFEDLLEAVPEADPLIALFAACEGARVDARLRRQYRGFGADLRGVARQLRRQARRKHLGIDLALFLVGAGEAPAPVRIRGLPSDVFETVARLLESPDASVEDALATAILLRERLDDALEVSGVGPVTSYDELLFEKITGETVLDFDPGDVDRPGEGTGPSEVLDLDPAAVEESDEDGRGTPLSAEELRRLLQAGAIVRVGRGAAEEESAGIFARGLSLPAADADATRSAAGEIEVERARARGGGLRAFEYDEWDYQIRDYRPRWCQLEELVLAGDAGEFFQQTLERYADLLPEVRRQFQRIRPERLQKIRRLEDGEDFDLNAVVEARIEQRARRTPSSRLYVARRREERDVATLFLLDMSASTDESVGPAEAGGAKRRRPRRIIDVTKEALVIMAEALEELGDGYAIYGFSGQGRRNVEFYPVKHFHEGLTPAARGRIGGIEPRRSTRMGTALRHAITKLAGLPARSRHILLLSDGFPQDFDYGQDRRSNTYGIQDTMMALQECQAAGIMPFCITVDKTGHDYLREMCERSRYLVIDDVTSLPTELPKIYERWVASRV